MMFDLKTEVRNWCRAALPEGCNETDRLDELEDHMYCEVARLEADGLNQQQAFEQASQRLGKTKDLMNEYSKNQSFIARLCALDRKLSAPVITDDPKLRKASARLQLGMAVLWAAAMIASSLLVKDSQNSGYLITLVFVPLWFASTLIVNRVLHSLKPPGNS